MSARIAEALVRRGWLDAERAQRAIEDARRCGLDVGQIIVERRWVPDSVYADVVASENGAERLVWNEVVVDRDLVRSLDEPWVRSVQVLPLAHDADRRLVIAAVLDPDDVRSLDALQFRIGRSVRPVVASRTELDRLIRHAFSGEPLDRTLTPEGAGVRADLRIDDSAILRGTAEQREAVQSGDVVTEDEDERQALARVLQENRQAAEALRAIFDLCIERGLFTRDELARRLGRD